MQAATFSAGGLALALATLSLEGDQRTRYVPPLVAARSAGLLARLCSLPAALEAMARPGAVDRIVRVCYHFWLSLDVLLRWELLLLRGSVSVFVFHV